MHSFEKSPATQDEQGMPFRVTSHLIFRCRHGLHAAADLFRDAAGEGPAVENI
jgi:hypothetical protein